MQSILYKYLQTININQNNQINKDVKNLIDNQEVKRLKSFIQISDSNSLSSKDMIITQKRDKVVKFDYKVGKINEISTFRECIKPGIKVLFSVKIDIDKLSLIELKDENAINFRKFILNLDFEEILKYSNEFTNDFITRQKDAVNKIPSDKLNYIITHNNTLPNGILGGGVGYFSKSLLPAVIDNENKLLKVIREDLNKEFRMKDKSKHITDDPMSPRTIKLAKYNKKDYCMGFCFMKVVEENVA